MISLTIILTLFIRQKFDAKNFRELLLCNLRYNTQVEVVLNKTISKFFAFVISALALSFIFSGCSPVSSSVDTNVNKNTDKISNDYEKPEIVGEIKSKEITESSGIAASRCNTDVFWTHNDSGDEAFLFALNAKGEKLGTFRVSGAKNHDWEDIAAFQNEKGECFLYIGDIGNNTRIRDIFTIYRVKEPEISGADKNSSKKNPSKTEKVQAIKFEYPDLHRDAETLMIHPNTGDIYILSKRLSDSAGVYKLSNNYSLQKTNKLEKLADFTVPAIPNGFLTGGDISPDGLRVVLCDYFNAYEIVLPEKTKKFDEIWKQKPLIIELGKREQGEAVCYSADGKAVFATSENKNSPIIKVTQK